MADKRERKVTIIAGAPKTGRGDKAKNEAVAEKKATMTLTASQGAGSDGSRELELIDTREGSVGELNLTFNRSLTHDRTKKGPRASLKMTKNQSNISKFEQKDKLLNTITGAGRGFKLQDGSNNNVDGVEFEIGEFQAGDTILDTCSSARDRGRNLLHTRTLGPKDLKRDAQMAAHLLKSGAPGLNAAGHRRRNILQSKKDLIALLREINHVLDLPEQFGVEEIDDMFAQYDDVSILG